MSRRNRVPVRRAFAPWADPSARPLVAFEGVTKRYGDTVAVDRLDLSIHTREFHALLGPSGCGKTTLMRMLAGFETPDEGRITLEGQDLAGVPPHRRPLNMMFQSYALFPHMSVAANIGYGLRRDGLAKTAIAARVEEMLALVKLEGLGGRRPDELSGGQRQRVALARAIAKKPKVLLLDEPLGALDKKLREATQFELMDLQVELGMTFLIVTHDQEEAMTMADRISVMDRGRIVQSAPPEVIYEAPSTRYVAGFVGDGTILEGRVSAIEGDLVTVETGAGGRVVLDEDEPGVGVGAHVGVLIRPEKITIRHERPVAVANATEGEVWDVGYLGDVTLFQVKVGGADGPLFKVAVANRTRRVDRPITWNDRVWLSWDVEAGVLLKG